MRSRPGGWLRKSSMVEVWELLWGFQTCGAHEGLQTFIGGEDGGRAGGSVPPNRACPEQAESKTPVSRVNKHAISRTLANPSYVAGVAANPAAGPAVPDEVHGSVYVHTVLYKGLLGLEALGLENGGTIPTSTTCSTPHADWAPHATEGPHDARA